MDIRSYKHSVIQGTKFLLSQQNDDGSLRPVEEGIASYCRVPFALAAMGQTERAARLMMYIAESVIDEEGDFVGHFPRSDLFQRYYLVPNAWLISGAHRLGRFGISLRGIEFLGSLQHPQTGGFFTAGPNATVSGEQDVLSSATCGLTLLYCGRLDEAIQVGQYLQYVMDHQPSPAARLLFKTRGTGEVVSEFSEENAAEQMMGVGKSKQWYHVPALAAGFLIKLAETTGSTESLDLAQKYLQFIDSCGSDRYNSEKSGLFGWAAALAYEATGNQNYRRIATSVADALLEAQLANGSWLKASMGEDLVSDVVDATAENLIALVQVLEGLVAGD